MEHKIENDILQVILTAAGAQIRSVVRKDSGVEHIWSGDPAVWKYHSPVLFPYTGKVRDGRIEIRGQVIENAPAHGVARIREHRLVKLEAEQAVFALEADEQTMELFPYSFRLLSTFRLEGERLCHTLTVENLDDQPFYFGIGYHPAFSVPFDTRHGIEDYELRFSDLESPLCLDTPEGLCNGRVYTLGNNIRSIAVEDGMFDVGSHCMVGLRSKTLGLYEKDSTRAVVCDIADFPYCLIWSQPGKPRFICIEPWHSLPSRVDDSYRWEDKAAAAMVAPGGRWSTTLKMSFLG